MLMLQKQGVDDEEGLKQVFLKLLEEAEFGPEKLFARKHEKHNITYQIS